MQKLFTFSRRVEGKTQNLPSEELTSAGQALVSRVAGITSALQVDAEDVAGYIRSEVYNYLTSSEYREIVSDLYFIMKEITAEIESEVEESKVEESKVEERKETKPSAGDQSWEVSKGTLPSRSVVFFASAVRLDFFSSCAFQLESAPFSLLFHHRPFFLLWADMILGTVKPTKLTTDIPQKKTELEDESVKDIERRLRAFLSRLSEKKEYQSMVNNFFKYSDQIYNILVDVAEDTKRTREAQEARDLLDQAYEILSDFAGKKEVEKYRNDLKKLWTKVKEDNGLQKWREESRNYIVDALKNPEEFDKEGQDMKKLIRQGRKVLQKYREDINVLYDDQIKIAHAIRDDPALKEFNQNLSNLGTHLALNSKGEIDPAKLQESMVQITTLMANLFHNYLVELPLTRVDIDTPNYDISMSEIKVRGSGFAPDRIEIATKSDTTLHFGEGKHNRFALLVNFNLYVFPILHPPIINFVDLPWVPLVFALCFLVCFGFFNICR